MTTVTTAVPDDLHVHAGEEIDFHVLLLPDGSFLVKNVLRREQPSPRSSNAPATLGDWTRQWAGVAALKQGQTAEDVKLAAYQARFGN